MVVLPGVQRGGRARDPAERHERAAELFRQARLLMNVYRPREAASLLKRALRVLGGDHQPGYAELRVRIYTTLAYSDAEMRDLQQGLDDLRTAERHLADVSDREILPNLDATIRGQRGILLTRAGQYDEGIAALDESEALLQRELARGAQNHGPLSLVLLNRALTHHAAGHPAPAERDIRRSVEVIEAGLRDGAFDADLLTVQAAKARHMLGAVNLRVGDVPGALQNYEEAGRSYQELDPSLLPKLRLDQAEALLAAGLAEEAAKYLDEALPAMRDQRDHQNLAEAEMFRAAAALIDGDLAAARKLASSARRQFLRRGSRPWAAIAALTGLRAEVAAALGRGRVPKSLPQRALALADELGELRLVDESSVARLLAVRLQLRQGDVDSAAEQLTRVPAPRRVTPVDHRMLLRLCRAELAVARGDRRRAFRQAGAGLSELGRIRDRMGGLDLVSGTAVHGGELGELAVRLVLDRRGSGARRLFTWLERTRAQVYRYEPLPQLDNPVLAERVQEYRHLSRSLRAASLAGEAPQRELASRLAALQREVMRLGWRDTPWGRPRPIAGVDEVIERLGDRVLVSFLASDDRIMAVLVADGRARLVRLGSLTDAVAAARELHADLDALSPDRLPPPLVAAVSTSARRRAERLDVQLFQPLAKIVRDRELVIVPTGSLYAAAWGALPSLRGRPVAVAPSATAWLAATRAPTSAPTARSTVLVGGPSLAAAVGEVGRLREQHPDAMVLDSDRATTDAVLTALDGAGLAHVAAHGAHETENALFSRLELVDGPLFAHEIARLRRPPEHVVLAACELALSRIRPGDEALGFAGALLAAGGQTVTAAVTRVGDEAAAAAMADYHRRLAKGAPSATALAEAVAVDPLRRPFICLGAGR